MQIKTKIHVVMLMGLLGCANQTPPPVAQVPATAKRVPVNRVASVGPAVVPAGRDTAELLEPPSQKPNSPTEVIVFRGLDPEKLETLLRQSS